MQLNYFLVKGFMVLNKQQKPPLSWSLIAVFTIVSVIMIASGLLYLRKQKTEILSTNKEELKAISELKTGQIVRWWHERIGGAIIIQQNMALVDQIDYFLTHSDNKTEKDNIKTWLNSVISTFDYSGACIYDRMGNERISVPEGGLVSDPFSLPLIPAVFDSKKVKLTDLFITGTDNRIALDLMIPLTRKTGDQESNIGLLILRIDPQMILFPLIESFPTGSKTSETLLLRKENDSVLFLNNVKYAPLSALRLKKPIENEKFLAGMAVHGFEGVAEGVDYRDEPVLGAVRKIPGTNWYMVAKIDMTEIDADLNSHLILIRLLIIFVISAFGAVIGSTIWRQRMRFYRTRYEAEMDKKALRKHFDHIMKYANDIIFLTDSELNIVEVNDHALEVYGYSRDEIIGMHLSNLRLPENVYLLEDQLNILYKVGYTRFETTHRRKDGSTFPIEISARYFEVEGVKYFQSIGRDITERKKIEDNLNEILERYNLAIQAAKLAVWEWDATNDKLIWDDRVYELYGVEQEKFPANYEAWLNLLHPEDVDNANRTINSAINDQQDYQTEFRIVLPDGSIKYIKAFGQVLRDSNGIPVRMIGINYDITEQKVTENLLREREYWLTESQRVGNIGSYIFDIRTLEWRSSAVLDEIFGIDDNYAKTLDGWNNIVHPEYRDVMIDYVQNHVITNKNPFDKEYKIINLKTGKEAWLYGRGEVRIDKEGNPFLLIGTVQDITARKESEILLQDTKQTFAGIFDTVSEAIYIHQVDGVFIDVNPGAVQMYGYTREELIGMTPFDIGAPDKNDTAKVSRILEGVFRTGRSEIFEFWGKRKNGEIFPKEVVSSKGKYFGKDVIISTARDITERKAAEEAVAQSRERLLSIFRAAPIGIGVVKERVFVEVNLKVCEMTGYTNEELTGKSSLMLYPSQSEFDFVGKEKYLQLRSKGVGVVETKWKRKDGEIIDILLASTHLIPGDESFGLTFTALDITDRKKAEDELIIAKEKAEESDRLKTAFLHNISHEIRTPMNAIVGFTALLDEPDLDAEGRRQFINIITQSTNQLLSIISDIVDISNVETNQVKLSFSRVEINPVVKSLFEKYSTVAGQRKIHFQYEILQGNGNSAITTDKAKLVQVLSNLLGNAFKYTTEGSIVFGYRSIPDGVEFFVRDTGIGIPEDKHERIFDRFYQLDNQSSRAYGGAGLGLSICKSYVSLLGGKIWVTSKPGKGSEFCFTHPV